MNEALAQQHRAHLERQARLNGLVAKAPVARAATSKPLVEAPAPIVKRKTPKEIAFKAIEDEFHDICRGAQAIYDTRMKDTRAGVRAARAALKTAEDKLCEAQQRFHEEYRANVMEADAWRHEARAAVAARSKRLSQLGRAATKDDEGSVQ